MTHFLYRSAAHSRKSAPRKRGNDWSGYGCDPGILHRNFESQYLVPLFAITVTYSGVASIATPIVSPLSGRRFAAVGSRSIQKVRHRIYEKEYLAASKPTKTSVSSS